MKNSAKQTAAALVFAVLAVSMLGGCFNRAGTDDQRMAWWRDARFGMFIHWGLYAVPAGEWNGETTHAEWIRTTARIPLETYDGFVDQFNPVDFNADAWVKMARDAGMKYIVITSKHHDGFCLFDSDQTDFNIMATPYKKDIMKALARACRKYRVKMCWYYSIMDWHHPDYLPRRDWEKDRSTEGADFDRYVAYMKAQLKELITNYGDIGVLWFDGEWERTWNREYGFDLYNYVRSLQPDIIINNRVGAGRSGMEGMDKSGGFAGDFGTPEQQIPATGLPGVDWETCMTMNDHWGWNKNDRNWKSSENLIRTLADIASKGGNFLLNVGPKADGTFPEESVERLRRIGEWMRVNGESIYKTSASPFRNLAWGRCTQKSVVGGTRLYLHVFDWPGDGKLVVPGIYNQVKKVYLLTDPTLEVSAERGPDDIILTLPSTAPDSINTVVVLEVRGKADIDNPPQISADFDVFIDKLPIILSTDREHVVIRYTLDGADPTSQSPPFKDAIMIRKTRTLATACFRDGRMVSGVVRREFRKVAPKPAFSKEALKPGLVYRYFEGDWNALPSFHRLRPVKTGTVANFSLENRRRNEYMGFEYNGFIRVPRDGVYGFSTDSDDGSRLYIGGYLVADNDGLHGLREQEGIIPLEAGYHPIRVTYFNKTGGYDLMVNFRSSGNPGVAIPDSLLFR
ncbi:alpha-L-fucosidase [bacterium]|nr:alpha-L-fucosidase [bacterium]